MSDFSGVKGKRYAIDSLQYAGPSVEGRGGGRGGGRGWGGGEDRGGGGGGGGEDRGGEGREGIWYYRVGNCHYLVVM